MPKRQLKHSHHRIIAHPIIRHLGPAACRQTNIRPVQVRQKRAVFTWVPPKNVQRTRDNIGLGSVYWRADCPPCRVALIESEHRADFVIDFEFTKVGRLFRPLDIPMYAADEIAFVKAIPCGRSNFDEREPRSEEHTSELQSLRHLVCRLLLE